uniref:Uncharacterized protein n=1 Tax=Rhizophora mucronata TaxID=61149 RepID=A0A2P2PY37_RHIMU
MPIRTSWLRRPTSLIVLLVASTQDKTRNFFNLLISKCTFVPLT